MRRVVCLLLMLAGLGALAGCGGSDSASQQTATSTSAVAGGSEPVAPGAGATTNSTASTEKKGSRFVVVTSLLGKPLPKEPDCRFAKTFVPDNPTASRYDGALALTVTCKKSGGYTPLGQIVNRAGSKPTEITCRDTQGGQLYCIYVPSTSVGLYFTGTDRAVVRRRLEHLIEIVASLPTGITPLSGTSTR